MRYRPMRLARLSKIAGLALVLLAGPAFANPELVVDVDSGQVLLGRQSTADWYPAALTTLMTMYVALSAVRDGHVTMDTPFTVSNRAANMPPSRMGLQPGVQVTLDNALKLLVVKSPNDVAVTVAEGISGSVEAFVDEMNAAGARLGLKESHFVNPTGLPDSRQVTSARDMAMIGRALLKEFPEHHDLFGIGALRLGDRVIPTRNSLIGRYAGADGMRTGFTCAAGLNVVASATHNGRRLIVVVLGSSSARARMAQATALLDRGFAKKGGALGLVDSLPSLGVKTAPDMRAEVCSPKDDTEAMGAVGGDGRGRRRRMGRADDRDRRPRRRAGGVDSHSTVAAAIHPSSRARLDATPACALRRDAGVHRSQARLDRSGRGSPEDEGGLRADPGPADDALRHRRHRAAARLSGDPEGLDRRHGRIARLANHRDGGAGGPRTAIAVGRRHGHAAGQRRQTRRARLHARSAIEWPRAFAGAGRRVHDSRRREFGDPA